ncbi:hypothetical protein JCGZ_11248 [Jatropha curcas]|uniref:Uncharacterized protein n=1 Tax=Jatropha curcas TaxID=180498 RepID=A0A067KPZ3_JATCU|nr:hypothetical protein JCGZ_11248 [Jatropha curcas]
MALVPPTSSPLVDNHTFEEGDSLHWSNRKQRKEILGNIGTSQGGRIPGGDLVLDLTNLLKILYLRRQF